MLIPTPINGEISLYFHLPFCHKKCDYCHFYVLPDKDEFKSLLLDCLIQEIDQKRPFFEKKKVCSIYFGGGTPALAGPKFIQKILSYLDICKLKDIEITLELNPENNDFEFIRDFYEAGINRLSIGAQSFNDTLLKKIGRTHNARAIEKAITNARKASFDNISIDLMYDLPGQTLLDWQETLQKAIQAEVNHISLYNLSIEPHTVFYKYRDKIRKQMPKPSLSIQMFEKAKAIFENGSYTHYEISAFCKNNQYSKHNIGYWLQRPHLGFGPSAFSFYEGERFQNIANLHKYSQKIRSQSPTTDFTEKLNPENHLKESLALHLRLLSGFEVPIFEERFGALLPILRKSLKQLIGKKLLIQSGTNLRLSKKGLLFHDEIASEII